MNVIDAEMNGIYIYLQRNQGNLRRERLFRDRLNPLEVYDDTEMHSLFRFQRCHIIYIVQDVFIITMYLLRSFLRIDTFITHSQTFTPVYCVAY